MDVEFTSCKVDSTTVTAVGRFVFKLSELKEKLERGSGGYDYDSINNAIKSAVANAIGEEILAERKMEIVNSINVQEIIDGVKLKVIEGFSLNKPQY